MCWQEDGRQVRREDRWAEEMARQRCLTDRLMSQDVASLEDIRMRWPLNSCDMSTGT
jgi:hypothetical protein